MSEFSIENLVSTLNGLKNEKSCLAQELERMKKQKVASQEQKHSLEVKKSQLQDMNAKMNDTLKIAQQKVQRTLDDEQKLQSDIEEKSKIQHKLNAEIDNVKDKESQDVEQYQINLSNLAKKFINARKFYNEENIEKELKELEEKHSNIVQEREKCEAEARTMKEELLKIKQEQEANLEKANKLVIPAEQQRMIQLEMEAGIKLLEECSCQWEQKLKVNVERIEQLKAKLKKDDTNVITPPQS